MARTSSIAAMGEEHYQTRSEQLASFVERGPRGGPTPPGGGAAGGGPPAPGRAAFFNGALIRYLDFNDSFLAEGETCHPSDNIGAVLAASEYSLASGRQFLTALAVAYQVQCRLSDVAPVRAQGFADTTQGAG